MRARGLWVVAAAWVVVGCDPSEIEVRRRPDVGGVADGAFVGADAAPDARPGAPDAGQDVGEVDAGLACTPQTCQGLGLACGPAQDGCAGALECGGCGAGEACEQGQCVARPADCSGIANTAGYELCSSSTTECAGVFTQGGDCETFCAAAGLACKAHYGGEAGCMGPELGNVFACGDRTGNRSDWCVCTTGALADPDPACPGVGRTRTQGHRSAVYDPRSSWVLECRPTYAYSAQFDEHEACDPLYRAGSGRGTATFTFLDVAPGLYDVYVSGRHTENRNSAGAVVHVDSGEARYTARIDQRDLSGGIQKVLHGTYCLGGTVTVVMDSSVNPSSDSVSEIALEAR